VLNWCSVFTALHVMQMRSSDENSVRLSVRLSIRHTRVLWQNGRKICPDLYTIRKNIYPSLLRRRMVGGGWGATPSTWNFGSTGPRWSEIADFQPIIACSASAVTPSKKVQLTLIGSPLRTGGGWPLVPEILDQSDRVGAKSPIFDLFSLVAPQP